MLTKPKGRRKKQLEKSQVDIVQYIDALDYTQAFIEVKSYLDRFNPTLKSILKVEDLFRKHIEFDSKNELWAILNRSIKPSVLNVILARLAMDNKIMVNPDDNSLTWIYAQDNARLKKSWEKATPLSNIIA